MNPSIQQGSKATPIFVFIGIVTLSVVFFFVFTLPKSGVKKAVPVTGESTSQPAAPPVPIVTAPVVPAPPPSPAPSPAKQLFLRSSQFLTSLTEQLRAGKTDEALKLATPAVPTERKDFFKKVFVEGFQPVAGANPWLEMGRISGVERWTLPLEKHAAITISPIDPSSPAPADAAPPPVIDSPPAAAGSGKTELTVDLKLTRESGYQITGLKFSPALVAALAPGDAALSDPQDPLSLAHDFVTELLAKDFRNARALTDGAKVTHEKLAGLCIVFEEGEYKIMPGSSLNVTAASTERAWAIVRVKSTKENLESEFGVELAKDKEGVWKVDSLDFSKLLQTYVQATDGGKVYYTPIVKSPNGGESLVVYFEYDKSELTERGIHQLEIVSDLLKSDPARKMRLSGYADALGAEDYNYVLSKRRAEAVQAKLLELGVNPLQVVTKGFGAATPLDPNTKEDGTDNPDGRSRNRRTEIYLDF